ncbi:MAG: PepSY domain-containing protein [Planctomycetes bacterium]|nr:PepSY domain-containing protein [Planctomycetota bacterium]
METQRRPKNWLLIKIRKWHTWLGVALSAFIVLVCLTGVYLNHRGWFEGMPPRGATVPLLSTNTDPRDLQVSLDRALVLAREHLGDGVPLDHVNLKVEEGRLVYKIKMSPTSGAEREMFVDAQTGALTFWKIGGYTEEYDDGNGKTGSGVRWGKLMMDLHTGKFFGGASGKLLIDITSFTILVLTVSGVYLWWLPLQRKRQSRRSSEGAVKGGHVQHVESCPGS